jgi:hypothetical protein
MPAERRREGRQRVDAQHILARVPRRRRQEAERCSARETVTIATAGSLHDAIGEERKCGAEARAAAAPCALRWRGQRRGLENALRLDRVTDVDMYFLAFMYFSSLENAGLQCSCCWSTAPLCSGVFYGFRGWIPATSCHLWRRQTRPADLDGDNLMDFQRFRCSLFSSDRVDGHLRCF